MTTDKLYRFLFDKLPIRGEMIYLDETWRAVLARHDYPEAVRQQLGQALAITGILSATIKFDGSLIFQIQGSGPMTTLVAQATHDGKLRGLARWKDEVKGQSLPAIYGDGTIVMTISNNNGERYQSIVALEGDQLSHALESYFRESEQLDSRFWLFVGNERVVGLFIQEIPSAGRNLDEWERICMLANTCTSEEILMLPPEEMLYRLFHEDPLRLFEPTDISFSCSCSRKKIEATLVAMGLDSLMEILQQEKEIGVDCEFCNRHYSFTEAHVQELFAIRDGNGLPPVLH